MFVFVAYAGIVWYLATRYRRTWRAFAAVAGGVAGLVFLAWLHLKLNQWTHGRIYILQLQVLLYPYTVTVAAVGFFVACLSRPYNPSLCLGCGYDRTGLHAANLVCPECGRLEYPLNGTACANCGLELREHPRPAGSCPKCGIGFRPAEPPLPPRADPRRQRAVYPRRIRHKRPHDSTSSGNPATTAQRHKES